MVTNEEEIVNVQHTQAVVKQEPNTHSSEGQPNENNVSVHDIYFKIGQIICIMFSWSFHLVHSQIRYKIKHIFFIVDRSWRISESKARKWAFAMYYPKDAQTDWRLHRSWLFQRIGIRCWWRYRITRTFHKHLMATNWQYICVNILLYYEWVPFFSFLHFVISIFILLCFSG